MRAAGVYRQDVFGDYFREVARHLCNGLRIRRLARRYGAVGALAYREVGIDSSISIVREALSSGRGVLLAPAHCTNYLVSLARLAQETPVHIYLRWSKDERRVAMKRQWCEAAGLGVIIEPPGAADPTSRAAACVEALSEGKVLAITPDIAQRSDEGTPVEWLGRTAFIPTGPASLAMLAEAPMIPLFARAADGKQVLYFEPPIVVASVSRAEGGRKEAIRRAMQTWTDGFERFILSHPHYWFLWGDSRWTRVLRGDPKYSKAETTNTAGELGDSQGATGPDAESGQPVSGVSRRSPGATGSADVMGEAVHNTGAARADELPVPPDSRFDADARTPRAQEIR